MGLDVPAPVAGIGGAALVAGGGTVALRARSQLLAATRLDQFATPAVLEPMVGEVRTALDASGDLLHSVQSAMDGARVPGTGLFRRIPFIGDAAADNLERAARIGAAAGELSGVDETALVQSAARLNEHAERLAIAMETDVARIGVAKTHILGATNRLAIGIGAAAIGAGLLGAALFDIGD